MASLVDIHTALAGRVSTVGLNAFDYPPQGATPPVAGLQLIEWGIDAFGRNGPRTHTFEVVVLTAERARPQDGYRQLMRLAPLIDTAIWDGNDRVAGSFSGTLSGVAASCGSTLARATGFRVLGAQEMDALQAYGGAFTVTVTTNGV